MRLLLLLPVLLVPPAPASQGPARPPIRDRADLRRDATRAWFGGDLAPAYLDFKGRLAAEHLARFAPSFPGGARLPGAPPATQPWVCLGPRANPTGPGAPDIDSGRPTQVLTHPLDPKILYLATSGGGVFKAVDADLAAAGDWTWVPITDGLPASGASGNLGVGALAMSPDDPETLFLGLGDAFDAEGRGLYRSTDGGATWTAATGLCAGTTRIQDILALGGGVVLAATNGGLLRSTDHGATFTCSAPFGAGARVWSLRRLGATGVLASVESGGGAGSLWRSTDGANPGLAWSQAALTAPGAPGRITLATSPASATLAWGIYEDTGSGNLAKGLLKTTDSGATWTFVASPAGAAGLFNTSVYGLSSDGGQGFYNHLLAVDPSDPNRLFVGSNLALYRTLDGGASYEQLTHWFGDNRVYAHADFHGSAWSKTGPAALYVVNDGGLAILRDPYRTPVPAGSSPASDPTFLDNRRNRGLATHLVYHVGSTQATNAADASQRISLGLQDNGTRIRRASGGGLAGSAVFEDAIGGDGFGTLWHPGDASKVLGSLYYTDIRRSTDGGTSFQASAAGISGAGDGGSAPFFTRLAPGAETSPDTVYTFTNTTVYRSPDFGHTWQAASTAASLALEGRVIRAIAASASDSGAVAVLTSGGTGFRTTDGGTSWSRFGTLPGNALYLSSVAYDPQDARVLYAASVAPDAGASHLWRSPDGGATWAACEGPGFPSGIPVHVVKADPTDGRVLFAGTDFGVYRSADAGATWVRYGTGLPLVAVRDLYLAPDGTFLRAATFGRGVWELAGTPVPSAPTIARDPESGTAYTGTRATFRASARGTPAPVLQWRRNATDLPGALGPSYTTPVLTLGDDGAAYSVAATNASGTALSAAAVLTVLPSTLPVITLDPSSQAVPERSSATFTAAATGTPAPALQWQRNGVDVPGATGPALVLGAVSDADHLDRFTLTATNGAGRATSAPAELTVLLDPPSIPAPPRDTEAFEGDMVAFTVVAGGTAVALRWSRNGVAIPNSDTLRLTVGPVTLADHGAAFRATATNRGGTVTSPPAALTVKPRPAAPLITRPPASQAVVEGQTATFTVEATGIPAPAYEWRRNGAPLPGSAPSHTTPPAALADDGAVYTVRVFNSEGSVGSTPATLTVTARPAPPAILRFSASPGAIQPGGSALLSWEQTGATGLVLSGLGPVTGSQVSVSPTGTTTYTLTASNAAGTAQATLTLPVRPRDLDGSGGPADVLDLAVLARAFSGAGTPTGLPEADLDGDGDCDEDDVTIFLAGFAPVAGRPAEPRRTR